MYRFYSCHQDHSIYVYKTSTRDADAESFCLLSRHALWWCWCQYKDLYTLCLFPYIHSHASILNYLISHHPFFFPFRSLINQPRHLPPLMSQYMFSSQAAFISKPSGQPCILQFDDWQISPYNFIFQTALSGALRALFCIHILSWSIHDPKLAFPIFYQMIMRDHPFSHMNCEVLVQWWWMAQERDNSQRKIS